MKKNLLIAIMLVLLLGASITVFALNGGNDPDNYNNSEGSELEMDVCPLEPETEVGSDSTSC